MSEIDFSTLTDIQQAEIQLELKLSREMRSRQHVSIALPKFSGSDSSSKGEVDWKTYKYLVESYTTDGAYPDAVVKTAVKKSLAGEAAQLMRNLGDATVSDIITKLDLNYGEVENKSLTW